MRLLERLQYAAISGVMGALLGVLGWWLYGVAHSLQYDGPGWHDVLRHWVLGCGGGFALLGFVLGASAADVWADTVGAVVAFEFQMDIHSKITFAFACVYVALLVAAIWWSTPAG